MNRCQNHPSFLRKGPPQMTIQVRTMLAIFTLLAHGFFVAVAQENPAKKAEQAAEKKTTPAKLSREEELRRERMRARLNQPLKSNAQGLTVTTSGGDVFVVNRDGSREQLTKTSGAEIAPQLANDGKTVAYVRDHALYAMDLGQKSERRLSKASEDGLSYGEAEFVAQEEMDRFDGFWFSPDGQWIAYQETDERAIPVYPIVHQGDTQWSVENHRYPFAGKFNANVRLGLVKASGGDTKWLDLLKGEGEQYLARVHWDSPSTFLVELLARDHKTLKMVRVKADTGESSVIFTEKAPDWLNLHEDFRLVDEKTGEFLWATEESGFKHLQLRSRDGRVLRSLTKGPGAVDKVVKIFPDKREVWYMAWQESPLESHLFRVGLDQGDPVRLTREPGMHDANVDDDGQGFTDRYSNMTTPSRSLKKDRDGQVLSASNPAAGEPAQKAARPAVKTGSVAGSDSSPGGRLVEFKSRDNVTLYGCYYPPSNLKPGQKAPLLVMVYGGPHVQTVTNTFRMGSDPSVLTYTSRGIAVWKMDNRGSSRRGHAFEASIYRKMGEVEVADQVDGVRHVSKMFPEVDPTRVGITGASYGGYMTMRALSEAPESFHVGVSMAPVTDWDGYDTCYTERYMETPATNPDGYRDSSVLTRVSKIKGKLLVIHGMIDENVHYRHTARFVQAMMSAGKPFELLAVPEGRHGFRRPADAAFARRRTNEFFFTHLLGDSSSKPAGESASRLPESPH